MARRKWNYETIGQVLTDENPFTQVGYTPKNIQRKIGDVWTDVKGITWEQRKGYRSRVNKQVDCIRELIKQKCSGCKKDINLFGTRYDEKFFPKTGMCYDCNIDNHTKLMVSGKFKEYEQKVIWSNQRSYLRDVKQHLEESILLLPTDTKVEQIASNGVITTWEGAQTKLFLESARADLEKVTKGIEELDAALEKLN